MLLGMNQTMPNSSSSATAAKGEKLTTLERPRPTNPSSTLRADARSGARKTIQARQVAAKVSATDAARNGMRHIGATVVPRGAGRGAGGAGGGGPGGPPRGGGGRGAPGH